MDWGPKSFQSLLFKIIINKWSASSEARREIFIAFMCSATPTTLQNWSVKSRSASNIFSVTFGQSPKNFRSSSVSHKNFFGQTEFFSVMTEFLTEKKNLATNCYNVFSILSVSGMILSS